MRKHIKLCGMIPILLACIAVLFLLFNVVVGASIPISTSGDPWAGVDFKAMFDGGSYIFYGEHEVPFAVSGRDIVWDDLNPVLYRVMGEEEDDGYITLMSDYPVDYQPYTSPDSSNYYDHYDDSYIRYWLNNDFLENAFSLGEQKSIVASNVITRTFAHGIGTEKTGPVKVRSSSGVEAIYPLITSDKIYIPWGLRISSASPPGRAFWTSGYADDPMYELTSQDCFKNGVTALIYTRLRTPVYNNTDYIQSNVEFYGNVNYRATKLPESIMPIFKLDPEKVIFASPVVTADPGLHQLLESEAYPAPETGTAYKLTVLDDSLDRLVGAISSASKTVAVGDTLLVEPSGQLDFKMNLTKPLDIENYSIRYKIVDSSNALVGYGGELGPFSVQSFFLHALDLDGQPLDEDTYDVYVWLQKDNETTSFTASTPHYFKIAVGEIPDPPPVLSDGIAIRSSDSAAVIDFTSDKAGTYYYQVLLPADPVPSVAGIKSAGGTGTAMSSGENTINLSTLSSGEQKIYIVGEDIAGDSNVLTITIPANTAPPLPPVISGGTATRSSDSAAIVKFTSDKAGTYYYQVLLPADPVPSVAGLKAASGMGAAMSNGENTINLSTLSSGEKKIYIVGEDAEGNASNVLAITIGAYTGSGGDVTGTTYTVKFESNGGSAIADIKVNSGNKASKPSNPSRSGYTFRGWFIDSGLSNEYDFNKAVTGNITLYAKWERDTETGGLNEIGEKPYINGYPNGTFKPDHNISRAEMATILYNLLAQGKSSNLDGLADFTDINTAYWAATALAWAVGEGHFKGYGDGTLRPNASITRAELAAVLHRVAQKENMLTSVTTTNISFNDVEGHWANNEIMQLAYRGIIQGYNDGSFGPQKHITRAEAVAMVSRLFGRSDQYKTGKSFSDLPAGHWAYTYIMNAANGR
ncbi:MAG: S-layer homology domain-containing protein [Clostridiales bacterium]|nr:S-layer homology domain-containing protein [Clostridiales bacterium]